MYHDEYIYIIFLIN